MGSLITELLQPVHSKMAPVEVGEHPFLRIERQANGLIVTGSETDVCVLAAVLDAVDFWLPCNCGAERHLQFLGRITRRKSIPERFINAAFAVLYGLQLLFFIHRGVNISQVHWSIRAHGRGIVRPR